MSFADSVLDAGQLGSDIATVEVWTLNLEGTHLECPVGGWWVNPQLAETVPSQALFRLVLDPHPTPTVPGSGIAGLLWNNRRKIRDSTFRVLPSESELEHVMSQNLDGPADQCSPSDRCTAIEDLLMNTRKDYESLANKNITWMSTDEIVNYLGKSSDDRAILINEAGLKYVAAVPFNFGGHQGVVIYFSHSRRSKRDDKYLLRAADLIGISSAVTNPNRTELEIKIGLNDSNVDRLKHSISWASNKISFGNKLKIVVPSRIRG